ncbi:MAG: SET domain-containing protein-lysine N-methyltransferase [Planctomycetes bacterium]|jgi:SET domain-containing protein|nr:SET domain-containing protein-lysine N-methyltransferase [Planctomycetota bacterium]
MTPPELIYVKRVKGKGRGVFARCDIKKGATIEQAPVLLVPVKDLVDGMKNRTLNRFFYHWSSRHVAVSLGYGSLYNHSYEPNARYFHGAAHITYRALRDIRKGEEILINYNYSPKNRAPMLFTVR